MHETNKRHIEVNLSDLILTPFTAATLVNELLKNILYQKSQIPYPYDWIKAVIDKRRNRIDRQSVEQEVDGNFTALNITYENHYRKVSHAYDNLNSTMRGIIDQFSVKDESPSRVLFVFGTVINCPKEVFCICLPPVLKGHCEQNHIEALNHNLRKVLRSIFLSQTWMDSIDATTPCTNVFIYLRKQTNSHHTNAAFEICDPFEIPSNVKLSTINILDNQSHINNCCHVSVFNENDEEREANSVPVVNVNNEVNQDEIKTDVWNRSINVFTGFKDCFVNKISVCQLW